MKITEKQTLDLITRQPEMNKLSFTIMIHRMARKYRESNSQETLRECTEEINAFLDKYYLAMAKDYASIMNQYSDSYAHDEDFVLLAA